MTTPAITAPAPYFCSACGWDVTDERGCSQGCGYKYVRANQRAVDRYPTDAEVSKLAAQYLDAMRRRA